MALRQLAFDITPRPAFGLDDFYVAPGNADAVAWLDRWPDWPNRALAIHGPAGCGKSHLAQVWRAATDARVIGASALTPDKVPELAAARGASPPALAIEDGDRGIDETALFHLYNMIVEAGGSLLLTGRAAPARWKCGLPDLASRLAAMPAVAIEPPDDEMFGAVLMKLFADRQLRVGTELINYLSLRLERSFETARNIVATLDENALAGRRDITVPLAREILSNNNFDLWEND